MDVLSVLAPLAFPAIYWAVFVYVAAPLLERLDRWLSRRGKERSR